MGGLLSKPAAIAVLIYVGAIVLCGVVLSWTVSDPIAMALDGWILALPWIALLPNVGHAYFAFAMNAITLYALVAWRAAHRHAMKNSK
jgi:amino acid permease